MSDDTTPEPERLLLNADFSTTRHSEPDPDDGSADHERQRREKQRLVFLADLETWPEESRQGLARGLGVDLGDDERPESSEETSG